MRVQRWPGGDFELEPGDMVQIRSDTCAHADCVYCTLVAGTLVAGDVERLGGEDGQVVKIPPDSPPAMFLGLVQRRHGRPADGRTYAQVLHDGKIVDVSTLYLEPVK